MEQRDHLRPHLHRDRILLRYREPHEHVHCRAKNGSDRERNANERELEKNANERVSKAKKLEYANDHYAVGK